MKIEKVLDKLLNKTETAIIATDNGIAIEGNGGKILSLLEMLIRQLKENGFSEDKLKLVFDNALKEEEPDLTFEVKNSKDLKKALNKILKNIKEDLDLGDEEDE